MSGHDLIDESPFDDGRAAGRDLGCEKLQQQVRDWLDDPLLCDDLGAMSEAALTRHVVGRFETEPNDASRPELNEIYPDRVDRVRGLADGAGCAVEQAALYDYLAYTHEIRGWTSMMQPSLGGEGCSGMVFDGPDGVLAGQNIDSSPSLTVADPPELKLIRPRSGYIEKWGLTNEHGVAATGGGSCGVWMDEPIVNVWPFKSVPLLRFARNVKDVEELSDRYRLFNWGRSSELWVDVSGDAIAVDHSARRCGVRHIENGALWATEGHFEHDAMNAFIRDRRKTYVKTIGRHLGANDLQYATDCAVRFAHLGELAHLDLGRGIEHMRHVMTDHASVPRGVCRHGGPDTDVYDQTVTLQSKITDISANCIYVRNRIPDERFCCEVPEKVVQYPPRPCDG